MELRCPGRESPPAFPSDEGREGAPPGGGGEVGAAERQLLVFSDLHLGHDLKRGSPPGGAGRDLADRRLGALLDRHSQMPGPWRLVLAGDVVDFIGISLTPEDVGETSPFELEEEERAYGLEPGPERCAWMMRQVLARHPYFFARLVHFLARGNDLVVVRGNHDAAFFWPEVQAAFREGLSRVAAAAGCSDAERAHVEGCVRFEDCFYIEPGRIYVEHGHLHDEFCAEPGARMVLPDRPNRLNQPVSTLLVRYFANLFPSLDHDAVDTWTAPDYVRWAVRVENPLRIGAAFLRTVLFLFVPFLRPGLRCLRRARAAARQATPVAEPPAVRAVLRGCAGFERLTLELLQLGWTTAHVGWRKVLQLLYLDRLAFAALALLAGAGCVAADVSWSVKALGLLALAVPGWLVERRLAASRRVAAGPKLLAAAESLARIVNAPLIVMGHSHREMDRLLADGATRYVNLGSWTGAFRPGPRAGFPYLVVRGQHAEFLRWEPAAEPAPAVRADTPPPGVLPALAPAHSGG